MKHTIVFLVVVCGGCHFKVGAIPGVDLGDTPDRPDLAGSIGGDDLGLGEVDFSGVTLDLAGVDLTMDPCGTPTALGQGNVAAQCVIGAPPTIDGDLTDWPTASFLPLTHVTAEGSSVASTWHSSDTANDADSSARYFVKWDRTYLYVAASITDDVLKTPNSGDQLSYNDALEIFLDGAHDRTISYGSDDIQLVFSADNEVVAGRDASVVTFPKGVSQAIGGTAPSWTLEVRIPWSLLGGSATIGRVIGFDLKLDDNDTGGAARSRDLVLFWRAASGGTCTEPACRTDSFGAVQLMGR